MIYVVATTQVKPEARDAFVKGAKECMSAPTKIEIITPEKVDIR